MAGSAFRLNKKKPPYAIPKEWAPAWQSELVGDIRSADTLAGAGLLGLGLAGTQLLCRLDQGLFSGAPVDASIGNRQAIFQVSRVAEFLVAAF